MLVSGASVPGVVTGSSWVTAGRRTVKCTVRRTDTLG